MMHFGTKVMPLDNISCINKLERNLTCFNTLYYVISHYMY